MEATRRGSVLDKVVPASLYSVQSNGTQLACPLVSKATSERSSPLATYTVCQAGQPEPAPASTCCLVVPAYISCVASSAQLSHVYSELWLIEHRRPAH